MKVLYGFVVLTLISISAFSQTNVSGTIMSDTEWTLAGSPYTLTAIVGISPNVTLTIHPGVQISGNFDLHVKGKVLVNGTASQPVEFNNVRLIFKNTDLSLTTINYLNFKNSAGLQLADESAFNEDSPKNSNTLIARHCSFASDSYIRSKGWHTTAKLRLVDCMFTNAKVYGHGNGEIIEIENAVINSSFLLSDWYHDGIHIRNSSVSQTSFYMEGFNSTFDISDSDIQNSSVSESMQQGVFKLNRAIVTNTYIKIPDGVLTVSDSKFTATSIPQTTMIEMASGSITNSTLEGNAGIKLVSVGPFFPNSLTIQDVTFKNFNVGLEVSNFNLIHLKSNNFINGTYNIKNLTNKDIDATNNYWGTADEQVIKNKIWDLYDDINSGIVHYDGFASTPFLINLPKPTKVLKGLVYTEGTLLRWTKVNDPTITGYKIYKKMGDTYTFVGDGGNSNTRLLSGEDYSHDFVVTAYTAFADGTDDQLDGSESPYSDISIPFLELSQSNISSGCEGESVQLAFTPNYDFDPNSSLFLVVSPSADLAEADTILTTAPDGTNNFSFALPDPLTTDQTFYFRIGSDEFDIFSADFPFAVTAMPAITFSVEDGCRSGANRISVTGLQDDVDIDWSLDGGTIAEETPSTFVATWTTAGEKTVTLTASRNGCEVVVTKVVSVSLNNTLSIPAICSIEYDGSSGNNKLSWQYSHVNFSDMKIYRELATNDFKLIATVPASEQSYLDLTSEASSQAYQYRISAVDKCGIETSLSEPVISLHLQLGQAPDGNWNLSWEKRDEASIEVSRQTNDLEWVKIGTLANIHTSFTDTDSPSGHSLYQAKVARTGSCVISSNIVSNGILSAEGEHVNLHVHPNPFISKLTFYYATNGQYELTTAGGVPVQTGTVQAGENDISVSSLSKGIYLLKVWAGKQQYVTKVVK